MTATVTTSAATDLRMHFALRALALADAISQAKPGSVVCHECLRATPAAGWDARGRCPRCGWLAGSRVERRDPGLLGVGVA